MMTKIPVTFDPYYMSELSEIVHGKTDIKSLSGHNEVIPALIDHEQSTFNKDKIGSTTQFVRGLKPVVILGRCLGLIARSDVLNKEKSKSKVTFATVLTACLSLFLFINAILTIRLNIQQYNEDSKTLVRKEGLCYTGYAIVMFLVYFYQLFATKRLRNIVQLFKKANDTSILIKHQSSGKKWFTHFPFVCAAIIIISMLLGITENILYDVQRSVRDIPKPQPYWNYWNQQQQKKASDLEVYYSKTFKQWDDILPSSMSPVTMIFVILVKFCTIGWIYMDIVSMVLCRAVWEKLRIMEQCLTVDLRLAVTTGRNSNDGVSMSAITVTGRNLKLQQQQQQQPNGKWVIYRNLLDDYQNEYLALSQLANEVETYISPLILSNYFCNLYTIVVLLFYWMEPVSKASTEVKTNEQRAYVWFAFLQFCIRVVAITYFAAEVYQVSMSIKRKLQNCPNDQYTIAVQRLDTHLTDTPPGIRLFNSYMITRHYFLFIIGLIIVAEIILLQAYSSELTPAPVTQG